MKFFKSNKKLETIQLVTVHKYKIKLTLINNEKLEYLTDWVNLNKYTNKLDSFMIEEFNKKQLKINNKLIKTNEVISMEYELYDIGTLDYTKLTNKEINYYFLYEDDYIIKHDL